MKYKPNPAVALFLESPILLRVPREQWASSERANSPERSAVWLSKHFMVQVFEPKRGYVRLTVNRPEIGDDGSWEAGISWDELQRCKCECGFGHRDAVEIYPSDSDVVDVSNMRHLWILPLHETLPCIWRRKPKRRQPFRKPTAEEIEARHAFVRAVEAQTPSSSSRSSNSCHSSSGTTKPAVVRPSPENGTS